MLRLVFNDLGVFKNNFVHDTCIFSFFSQQFIMVQGRVLFGAEFHFFHVFLFYNSKSIIQVLINVIFISEVLKHMLFSIKMANIRKPVH